MVHPYVSTSSIVYCRTRGSYDGTTLQINSILGSSKRLMPTTSLSQYDLRPYGEPGVTSIEMLTTPIYQKVLILP